MNQPKAPARPPMSLTARMMLQNKAWAQSQVERDPRFFARLADQQVPKVLWIGCSDSRVAADTITGTDPGSIFVHRNIANVVVHTDLNLLSVMKYAVDVLQVEHVIVCGHPGCGGVRAAMSDQDFGLLNEWLRHIKDVCAEHLDEINAIADLRLREDRMVELHARQQLRNLAMTSIIQKAWATRGGPTLHAWVYDLADGVINELQVIDASHEMKPPYRFDFSK